jgi:hypothetical protein
MTPLKSGTAAAFFADYRCIREAIYVVSADP